MRPGNFKLQFPLLKDPRVNLSCDQVIAFNLCLEVLEACVPGHPEKLPADERIKTGFGKAFHDAMDGFLHECLFRVVPH